MIMQIQNGKMDSKNCVDPKRRADSKNRPISLTVYQKYQNAARARKLMEEYRSLARLVDDLDIRFWKGFVFRNQCRIQSVDTTFAEESLRDEYKSCVSDLIILRGKVNKALDSISSMPEYAVIKDYYIRDMSMADITDKWRLKEAEILSMIQRGLMEMQVTDEA